MICRTCLRRASGLRQASITLPTTFRALSISASTRQAAAGTAASPASSTAEPSVTPKLSTPLEGTPAAASQPKSTRAPSSCPAGTVLNGLNYFKGKTDPVALPDEQYPDWLWDCLTFKAKTEEGADANAGDEFCRLLPSCICFQKHLANHLPVQPSRRSSVVLLPSARQRSRLSSSRRAIPRPSRPRSPCSNSRSTFLARRAATSNTTSTHCRSAKSSGRRCARSARPRSRKPTTSSRCKRPDWETETYCREASLAVQA